MKIYGVIGAGGFGREVMPLLKRMIATDCGQDYEPNLVFVVEDEYKEKSLEVNGYKIVALSEFLEMEGEKFYCIAIADSIVREKIVNKIDRIKATPVSVFSETFISLDGNQVGEGAVFGHYSQVTSNAKIGKHFQCNIYSYVAHDVTIGDFVTFAPGVKCNGHVIIEDHVYVGSGAVIKDGSVEPVTIGRGAVIGMGAVVTKSVEPYAVVVGNPARALQRQ